MRCFRGAAVEISGKIRNLGVMKIVVLDGYALNPGDLSWAGLASIGTYDVYERTARAEIIDRACGADALLTNKVPLDRSVLGQLPGLKYIGVTATGYNIIDTDYAAQHGIVVTNVPGYSTDSVVQLTFALLLELCQRVQRHSDKVKDGKWARSPDFCFWDYPLTELSGKTMGIIGFGDIGQRVADVATGFGMRILANSRTRTDQSHRRNFKWADIAELLEQSDVVSLHCPLTPQTEGLINRDTLRRMKSTAFLINTARGPIVDETHLAEALNAGQLAGAGLDVLTAEPPMPDNPLFSAKNCLITPHIAWATKEARNRLMEEVIGNLTAFMIGKPINVIK